MKTLPVSGCARSHFSRWLYGCIAAMAIVAAPLRGEVAVSFNNADLLNTANTSLGTVTLAFTVDGSGNVTLNATTTNTATGATNAVNAWDGAVGTVTSSAAYNTSFTLTMDDVGASGDLRLCNIAGGALGVAGTNQYRIDRDSVESIRFTATTLPAGKLKITSMDWRNINSGPTIRAFTPSISVTNAVTTTPGTWDLSSSGFLLAASEYIDFGTSVTGDMNKGYSFGALRFDIIDVTSILPPTGLAASTDGAKVDLNWNDTPSAVSYSVYRSASPGGPYGAAIATGLATSDYTDTTVSTGSTYYYAVTATNSTYGESPQSAEVGITPYTSVAGSTLYVHLDATNSGSVSTTTGVVNTWQDLTANGIDAVEVPNGTPSENVDTGDVLYPSTSLSASGLAGLNFGPARNLLNLFDPAGQDAWLDFSSVGSAQPYSGFAVFIALKADSILGVSPELARDVVFANTDNISGKFLIRYQSGRPEMYLNGVAAVQGTNRIVAGDTVILAANYNTATGALEFWDSASGAAANATVSAADFSSLKSMQLGGSVNIVQRMDGMIGEVKIFRGTMTPSAFASERDALVSKWITGTTGGYSTWQTANNTTGAIDEDHDADGVGNGVEYFLGGNSDTTGFTPLPGVLNTAGALSVTWSKGSGYSGDYDANYWIETSTTLTGAWTKETLGGGNVTDDPGFVKYTFPAPLSGKRFVRLKVTGP